MIWFLPETEYDQRPAVSALPELIGQGRVALDGLEGLIGDTELLPVSLGQTRSTLGLSTSDAIPYRLPINRSDFARMLLLSILPNYGGRDDLAGNSSPA